MRSRVGRVEGRGERLILGTFRGVGFVGVGVRFLGCG